MLLIVVIMDFISAIYWYIEKKYVMTFMFVIFGFLLIFKMIYTESIW